MLQFVDDTMFLYKDSIHNIVTINDMLRCFELALGIGVNLHKSSIVGIWVYLLNIQRYVVLLNC